MLKTENISSMYKGLSLETLDLVKKLNKQKECTFLIPTRFISSENAQLAYLLNEYYNYGREDGQKKLYRSFFASTRYEALQGAIKLIRHNGIFRTNKKILVIDPKKDLSIFVNPLDEKNVEEYLIPEITFVNTLKEMIEQIKQSDLILGAIFRNSAANLSCTECSEVIKICKEKKIITLWDDSDHELGQNFSLHKLDNLTDMVILGETVTDNEVPFGIFSMTAEVHKPWTSAQSCLFHSSTYSGNKLAVRKAKDNILNKVKFLKNNNISEILGKIDSDMGETLKYFSEYINPGMVKFYSIIGYDFNCKSGKDSLLTIKNSKSETKEVLDAVAGGGAAIRGHCSEDILTNVLQNHSESEDYWGELAEKLKMLFSFPRVFPAVSGATAVEIAYILSLLASKGKKRIIVFKNNFAGNTLISLIGTANKMYHNFFQPIYKHLTVIDPFSQNSEQLLTTELEKGDVALVWLEILQGGTLKEIPGNLLKIIQDKKEEQGFYLGVDEILMGFYRIDKLASYHDTVLKPDVITFSKALSDGTFPMAATLVSEEIYKNAYEKNSEIVSAFETLYKNQFGAHIALNSIDKLTNPSTIEQILKTSKLLKQGLEQIKKESPYLNDIEGKGHIYKLGYKNKLMGLYFCKRAIEEENLFLYIDRIATSVTITEENAIELIERLKRLYKNVGNPFIFKIKSIFITIGIMKKLLFK